MASVLIVDVQAASCERLATVVRSAGHTALESSGGETSLALARKERPDLIITDILMPVMDGYELVRQLRSDRQIAGSSVIFATASRLDDQARRLAQSAGVKHFLVKPGEPDEILEVVALALNAEREPAGAFEAARFDREHMRLLNDQLIAKIDEFEELDLRYKQLNADLRSSELSHRLLFEHNPQPMLAYHRATLQIVAASNAAVASYGYSREEFLALGACQAR